MVRLFCSFCLLPALLFSFQECFSQKAAEKLDKLKNKIRIWVLMEPNVTAPDFYSVKPSGVFLDTDGIIMGKKSNNGMDVSAQLLSALFKDASKPSNGGHQNLQDNIYQLIESFAAPVDIFFINDITTPLDSAYSAQYGYFLTQVDDKLFLEDAAYKTSNLALSSGNIVISAKTVEDIGLEWSEKYLVYLLAKLLVQDYSFATYWYMFHIENKNPPIQMYQNDPLIATRAFRDTRNLVRDAIAYSFSHFNTGKVGTDIKDEHYLWLESGAFFMTEVHLPRFKQMLDVPQDKTLNHRIRQTFRPGKDTGYIPTNPPFDNDKSLLKNFKIYCLNFLDPKIVMQNNIVVALYCEMMMKLNGVGEFIKSLIARNGKFFDAKPEDQWGILVENLCTSDMLEKSVDEAVRDKTFSMLRLFPLALMDLYMEFPMEGNLPANLTKFDPSFYGVFPTNSISKTLLEEYFKIRPQLFEVANKANPKKAIGIRNTGYTNFQNIVNAIMDFMVVNG